MTNREYGFTLVELMLAMTFIAILLVAIGSTTIFIANTYSKGISLKEVNQIGRDIDDYLRRDILASRPMSTYYVAPSTTTKNLGRLCLGNYSYLWTPADILNTPTLDHVNYTIGGALSTEPILFARVEDSGGKWCKDDAGYAGYMNTLNKESAKLLLQIDTDTTAASATNYNLAIHELQAVRLVSTSLTSSSLYHISFVIGTNEKSTINGTIGTMNQTCKPPTDATNNFAFCAVNMFDGIYYSGYSG